MEKRKVGNPLALAVLSWLTQRPMHPYELGRGLEDTEDYRSIKFNRGSLYMVVKQLAKAGLSPSRRPAATPCAPNGPSTRSPLRGADCTTGSRLVAGPRHEYPHFVAALSLLRSCPRTRCPAPVPSGSSGLDVATSEIRGASEAPPPGASNGAVPDGGGYRLAMYGREAFVARFLDELAIPSRLGPPGAEFHK